MFPRRRRDSRHAEKPKTRLNDLVNCLIYAKKNRTAIFYLRFNKKKMNAKSERDFDSWRTQELVPLQVPESSASTERKLKTPLFQFCFFLEHFHFLIIYFLIFVSRFLAVKFRYFPAKFIFEPCSTRNCSGLRTHAKLACNHRIRILWKRRVPTPG